MRSFLAKAYGFLEKDVFHASPYGQLTCQAGFRLCGRHISETGRIFLHLNFFGIVLTCTFPIRIIWACSWTRAHIPETDGWIFPARSSKAFSRLVVVQQLVICPFAHGTRCYQFDPPGHAHRPQSQSLKPLKVKVK